jgi:hypothetical protein
MRLNKHTTVLILRTTEGKIVFAPLGINKFILSILGFGLNGWGGLIIGLLFGSVLDCKYIRKKGPEKEVNLQLNYLMLGVYMLQRSNGFRLLAVPEIMQRFNSFLGVPFMSKRIRLLEDLSKQRIQVDAVCRQIELHALPTTRDWLLMQLMAISDHPGAHAAQRRAALQLIAERLGRPLHMREAPPQQQVFTEASRLETYFRTLECQPGDNQEIVKKAYYRLAKQHHPDRNHHSPISIVRFREIKEAYEWLKKHYGWN